MWFVGLQLFIWAATGLYMVSIDIHTIHGDHAVLPPPALDVKQVKFTPQQMLSMLHQTIAPATIEHISLRMLSGGLSAKSLSQLPLQPQALAVYEVILSGATPAKQLYNATTGELISPFSISEIEVITLAQLHEKYQSVPIKDLRYLTQLPSEVSSRHAPAYRITLDTWHNLTLYVDPYSAKIVTKRHDLWRIFDWAWRLHITDYDDGENVHNWWLQLLSVLSMVSVMFGIITLFFRFKTRRTQHTHLFKRHIVHKWLACVMLLPLSIWLLTGIILSFFHSDPTTSLRPTTQLSITPNELGFNLTEIPLDMQRPPIEINIAFKLNQWLIEVIQQKGFHTNLRSQRRLFHLNGQAFSLTTEHINQFIKTTAPTLGKISEIDTLTPNWWILTGYQNPVLSVKFSEHSEQHYFDRDGATWIGADTPKNQILQFMRTLHFMDYLAVGGFNHIWNILFAGLMLIMSISGIYLLVRPRIAH